MLNVTFFPTVTVICDYLYAIPFLYEVNHNHQFLGSLAAEILKSVVNREARPLESGVERTVCSLMHIHASALIDFRIPLAVGRVRYLRNRDMLLVKIILAHYVALYSATIRLARHHLLVANQSCLNVDAQMCVVVVTLLLIIFCRRGCL